jgi:hypothetical protein
MRSLLSRIDWSKAGAPSVKEGDVYRTGIEMSPPSVRRAMSSHVIIFSRIQT